MTITITATLANLMMTRMLPADEAWQYRVKLFDMGRPVAFVSGEVNLAIAPCHDCEGFSLSGSAEDVDVGLKTAGAVPLRPESCRAFGFPDETWGLR